MAKPAPRHYVAPTPSPRIWTTYELAFVALIVFALVGILAGFTFTMLGVPLAFPTRPEATPGAVGDETAAGVVRLGILAASVDEGSGLATSRANEGVLWVHNDDPGPARLFAVDHSGALRGTLTVPGVQVRDPEDLAYGPCPSAAGARTAAGCLYLADIGDNDRSRASLTILVLEEPDLASASGDAPLVAWLAFTYDTGESRDAEALAVTPDGRVFVVTKGQEGRADLFVLESSDFRPAGPASSAGAEPPVRAERLATLPIDVSSPTNRVTGAAVSPDGEVMAVRTGSAVYLFPVDEWSSTPTRCGIPEEEPQGEAIDFLEGERLVLTGEAFGRPAPILEMSCSLRGDGASTPAPQNGVSTPR